MAADESRLIQQAQQGSIPAFEELVRRYERSAFNLALRVLGNHADAADVAQEAFLKVYIRLGSYRGDSAFSTWLHRVVANACTDHVRRRRPACSLDQPLSGPGEIRPPQWAVAADTAEEAALRHELQAEVREAVDRLPPDQRLLVVLRDLQDLTYQEIVVVTGLKLSTVKTRLHRARVALKSTLIKERRALRGVS